jgi:hypothetical protein
VAYHYDATNALPMPIGKATAAIAELPGLPRRVEGQAKNQFAIFLDLEIWKTCNASASASYRRRSQPAKSRRSPRETWQSGCAPILFLSRGRSLPSSNWPRE